MQVCEKLRLELPASGKSSFAQEAAAVHGQAWAGFAKELHSH
jgi:hypothetical protein